MAEDFAIQVVLLLEGILTLQRTVLNVFGGRNAKVERIGVLVHGACCVAWFRYCHVSCGRLLDDSVLDPQQRVDSQNRLGIAG